MAKIFDMENWRNIKRLASLLFLLDLLTSVIFNLTLGYGNPYLAIFCFIGYLVINLAFCIMFFFARFYSMAIVLLCSFFFCFSFSWRIGTTIRMISKINYNRQNTCYEFQMRDSLFILRMDKGTSGEYGIFYKENDYFIGWESGKYHEIQPGEYCFKVKGTKFHWRKSFQYTMRNDSIYNFHTVPFHVKRRNGFFNIHDEKIIY